MLYTLAIEVCVRINWTTHNSQQMAMRTAKLLALLTSRLSVGRRETICRTSHPSPQPGTWFDLKYSSPAPGEEGRRRVFKVIPEAAK